MRALCPTMSAERIAASLRLTLVLWLSSVGMVTIWYGYRGHATTIRMA
jgi:hypothetical protein